MLRLNMAIAPTGTRRPGTSNLGLLGGDLAGFPNGRRVTDDVVTIELKAVAGATIPLVDKTFTPDAAVARSPRTSPPNPRPTSRRSRTWPTRTPGSPTRRPLRRATTTPHLSGRRKTTWTRSGHDELPPGSRRADHRRGALRRRGPGHGRPESLVLDIGGDVGALILYADEECLGLRDRHHAGGRDRRATTLHTMIRRRRAVAREFVAGVYPELPAGTYTLWGLDGKPLTEVVIAGGRVPNSTPATAGLRSRPFVHMCLRTGEAGIWLGGGGIL